MRHWLRTTAVGQLVAQGLKYFLVLILVFATVGIAGIVGVAIHRHPSTRPTGTSPQATVPPVTSPAAVPNVAGATTATVAGDIWVLPAPARYDGIVGVGFPHTTAGAVALGYGALIARYNIDPDLAVSVVRATSLVVTPSLLQAVAAGTQQLRSHFGIPASGPTPTTFGLSLVGCQVQAASDTTVVAAYTGTLSVTGGNVAATTVAVSVALRLVWNGTDWRIDPGANLPVPAVPPTLTGSWHPCQES